MNFPDSSVFSWSCCIVRLPSVAAAIATDRTSGLTRT
jgi:hypothetical protein